MSSYAANAYRTRSISGASPALQVAMLLETCAKHMTEAQTAIVLDDMEGRFAATEKAQTIITGLQSCLNDTDPDAKAMAEVFDNFYTNMTMLIMRVNLKNDGDACDVIIKGIKQMADTWRQIASQGAPQPAGQGAPPPTRSSLTVSA